MGALIGYYATSLRNLSSFAIDKSVLDSSLKSVINYVESKRGNLPIEYLITPENNSGELRVNSMPTMLMVRQLGLDFYPSRTLYVINFNDYQIREQIKAKALKDGILVTDQQVMAQLKEIENNLRMRLPFTLTVEQDIENKEKLSIESVSDKNGDDLKNNIVEINIQSLGIYNKYWLDTGAFEIL